MDHLIVSFVFFHQTIIFCKGGDESFIHLSSLGFQNETQPANKQ